MKNPGTVANFAQQEPARFVLVPTHVDTKQLPQVENFHFETHVFLQGVTKDSLHTQLGRFCDTNQRAAVRESVCDGRMTQL